jgi:hypothetical protein
MTAFARKLVGRPRGYRWLRSPLLYRSRRAQRKSASRPDATRPCTRCPRASPCSRSITIHPEGVNRSGTMLLLECWSEDLAAQNLGQHASLDRIPGGIFTKWARKPGLQSQSLPTGRVRCETEFVVVLILCSTRPAGTGAPEALTRPVRFPANSVCSRVFTSRPGAVEFIGRRRPERLASKGRTDGPG